MVLYNSRRQTICENIKHVKPDSKQIVKTAFKFKMLKPVTLINTVNQLKVWPEFIKAVKTQFNIPLKREFRKNTLQMHGDEREEYYSL